MFLVMSIRLFVTAVEAISMSGKSIVLYVENGVKGTFGTSVTLVPCLRTEAL